MTQCSISVSSLIFSILEDLGLSHMMELVRAELLPVQPYHGDLLVAVGHPGELLLVLG